MGRSSLGRRGRSWSTDWLTGIAAVLALTALHLATDVVGALERRLYDLAASHSQRLPSDRIAIIAIDDQSVARIGAWPWPRDVHAQLIDQLSAAQAKTIAYAAFFFEPQPERALVFIRKIRDALGAIPQGGRDGTAEQLGKIVAEAERTLDGDARLAASMARAGNVLLPSVFELGDPQGNADGELPAYVASSTIPASGAFSVPAMGGRFPIAPLGRSAAGVGHLNQLNDGDAAVRDHPLLVNYRGRAVPSMALLAAANSLGLRPADIRIDPGQSVQLGKLSLKTDPAARMRPHFYPGRDGKASFPVDSFHDVLSGKIPASKYTGKIVLVGTTAAAGAGSFAAPGGPGVSSAETMAHAISGILREHVIVQPAWSNWAALAACLLVAVYLVALLPRLSTAMGAAATALAIALLAGGEFLLLSAASLWLKFMFPAALLAIGQLALLSKRFLLAQPGKLETDGESAQTHHLMGLALQGQGRFDAAFDRFRRVPMSTAVMDNLYNLALDFERERQFDKARGVFEHMAAFDPKFKDVGSRLNRAGDRSPAVLPAAGRLPAGAVDRTTLGRYEVERELGKGSMGVVYLGRDPKIGRVVAIKTMALSEEYEGEELIDARERFFREAETAGRLQHQHIVTIFDAGEEHDLAYIAMEFLKGKDLAEFCRPGRLLPVPKVLSIVARVAQALAYAHKQNVVHRDIKPANIMYELETDTVKVTDFGIARITDSNRTKTGLVLGTPSFMSPEQIAGKKVDGRSDLYSLGVMLFQMLAGVLPLRGESMAELMHKIANEEAPDIRIVRPDIPELLANIVALALSKRPETRYQDGDQLATDLRLVLAGLDGATAGKPAIAGAAAPHPDCASPAAARGSDQTVAMSAASAVAAILHGPARGAAARSHPAPGYDPGGQADAGDDQGAYARTAVMRRPPARVATGDDKTDLEA